MTETPSFSPTKLTPAALDEIGRRLYDSEWRAELSRALGVNHRTIQRFMKGERDLPAGVVRDLVDLIDEEISGLNEARALCASALAGTSDQA